MTTALAPEPTTHIQAEKFQFIPLDDIQPSPMNPRKRFEKSALAELSESIKVHGVRQPILVRPNGKNGRFEIVVGERRWRASKLAGQSRIPAIVDKSLSDAQALEIMVIENLQREDVHPLDEALGYEALMKRPQETDAELGELPGAPKHTAESIAAKVGKSVGYVYARLKLLALIPVAREAFEKDFITPGHAVLIARLQPIDQVRALDACFHSFSNDRELKKLDPAKVKLEDLNIDPLAEGLLPEKALREWIQDNINLRLKDVPWDLNDAELVPEAGACANCLKRSTSNPGLFGDLAVKGEDTCFDAICFKLKREAFVKRTLKEDQKEVRQEAKNGEDATPLLQLSDLNAYTKPKPDQAIYRAGQWKSAKKGSCADAREGIMVRGEEAGQKKIVCVNPSCKVHKHELHGESASSRGSAPYDYQEENFQRHREQIRIQKRARARAILAQEVVKTGNKLTPEFLRFAIQEIADRDLGRCADVISWLLGEKKALKPAELEAAIQKADEKRLIKFLLAVAVNELIDPWGGKKEDEERRTVLIDLAKSFSVKNPGGVLTSADKDIAAAKSCRACGCTEAVPCDYYDDKKNKYLRCSWTEGDADLCSNPACAVHESKKAKKK